MWLQVPLILAWAISIHKSQGQTIQRVKIDLGKVFEKGAFRSILPFVEVVEVTCVFRGNTGQSYVALSRAASMEGLQVLRFDPNRVRSTFISGYS